MSDNPLRLGDGASGAFADESVLGERDNEYVGQLFRGGQVFEVSGVQQVKGSVA